tara:strand:- start:626 stop:952 length:327 start_codon:yes stop_codon:yes gene_type:complete
MNFYNTKNPYSYRKLGDKTRKFNQNIGQKFFQNILEYAPKIYDVATRIPNAIKTYSELVSQAEREGFKEQMSDMIGSKTLTSLLFNPFTVGIMRKYGKGNNNNPNDWN